ncbi:unnamed protein product [Moneuplotes crassus]|uniref:Uncharacterized protein n=1 Tax=Euplotes crassus TaxID=5936 RepID=A0AAD1Y886_EUPCR|nr:unnamed protein product [Moneuplotes crassus]
MDKRFSNKVMSKNLIERELDISHNEDNKLQNYCKVVQKVTSSNQMKGIAKIFLRSSHKPSKENSKYLLSQSVIKSRNELLSQIKKSRTNLNKEYSSFTKLSEQNYGFKKLRTMKKKELFAKQEHNKLTRSYNKLLKKQIQVSNYKRYKDFVSKKGENLDIVSRYSSDDDSPNIDNVRRSPRNTKKPSIKGTKSKRRSSILPIIQLGNFGVRRRSSAAQETPNTVMRFM